MTSKEVADRQRDARNVCSAGVTHGAAATTNLAGQLRGFLRDGEHMPDVALLVALMGRRLEHTTATLVTRDRAHELELGDDAAPRTQRDDAAAEAYSLCVEVRDQIASVLGDAALVALGITGETPTDASALSSWANGLVANLRNAAVVLPAPRRRTAHIDRAVMADEVAAKLTPLDAALADVARERREAEATQSAKNAASAEHDAAFAQTAGLYVALFRAAGMSDIADKVRPSRRRPGRTEEEGDPTDPVAPTPVAPR